MVAVGREGCLELCAPGFPQGEQAAFRPDHMCIRLFHSLKGGEFPSQPGRNQLGKRCPVSWFGDWWGREGQWSVLRGSVLRCYHSGSLLK